jgi:hypothetical protein
MGTMTDLLRLAVDQFLGRFSGPLNFRLMVMPTVVTIIALRAVWKDLREGRPAFLGIWIQDPVERKRIFHGWFKDVGRIFLIAVVLDITYQLVVFRWIYPGMVLVVAFVCAVVPYVLVRGPVHLIASLLLRKSRGGHASQTQPKQEIE